MKPTRYQFWLPTLLCIEFKLASSSMLRFVALLGWESESVTVLFFLFATFYASPWTRNISLHTFDSEQLRYFQRNSCYHPNWCCFGRFPFSMSCLRCHLMTRTQMMRTLKHRQVMSSLHHQSHRSKSLKACWFVTIQIKSWSSGGLYQQVIALCSLLYLTWFVSRAGFLEGDLGCSEFWLPMPLLWESQSFGQTSREQRSFPIEILRSLLVSIIYYFISVFLTPTIIICSVI